MIKYLHPSLIQEKVKKVSTQKKPGAGSSGASE